MAHDVRDQVVDFVRALSQKTELPVQRLLGWLSLARGKFFDWQGRYGKVNEHNAWIPRDHWITDAEREAILAFHARYPLEGYRRLSFMMLDAQVVAVSPASVYRVLRAAGVLDRFNGKASRKGTGFVQPLKAHEHWHIDISYLNIAGTFYYLCSILEGYSRFIVSGNCSAFFRCSQGPGQCAPVFITGASNGTEQTTTSRRTGLA